MSHDGCSTHRDIFLKSGSEENVLKCVDSVSMHARRVLLAKLRRQLNFLTRDEKKKKQISF